MRLRILHLEDSPADAELVSAALAASSIDCEILRVDNRSAFTSALETQTFDLILADMSLPSFNGIEGLALAKLARPGVPFLFVSGSMGEEVAVETLKQGAKDYVLKDRMARLGPAVRRALEEKQLEAQFRQAQKMEAVGTLAGGISHDFNNILTVILGHCELLLKQLPNGDRFREEITEIQTAGVRAATLTRQLLAFSRKQLLEPVVLDLNEVVTGLEKMLRRLIPESIRITASLDPESARIKADRSQLEQIVMNLVVNARDAMAEGGQITIETKHLELDTAYAGEHGYVVAGPHVMLAVSDTGSGMDRETKSRIFEPFFTTKEQGHGTGLGLSTVYGIVKQSGGSIEVYSELGQGTVFKIYFPEFVDPVSAAVEIPARDTVGSLYGSETVLLVEDETGLRSLARRALEMYGYHVLEGSSAESAVQTTRAHNGTIHLLLTDTVMPGRSGPELVRILTAERPDLKVVYMSGYTSEGVLRHGLLKGPVAFLQKPFTPDALVAKVRSVLDASDS